MSDTENQTSAPPMRDAAEAPKGAAPVSQSAPEMVWGFFKGALGRVLLPVQSLWTARTLWLAVGVLFMGWLIGWRDVRYFGLVSAWTVLGIVVAFHGRRFLAPDVKLSELYALAKDGNLAAAVVACGVLATQIAIMVILSVALLYRPASVS
jgi:hypothetical protein